MAADGTGYDAETQAAATALRSGRRDDAAARIDALLTARPEDPDALNLKAALLSLEGRHWDALPFAARAAAARPEDARLALNHAALLVNVQDYAAALSVFDRVLAARPNDLRALVDRGRTLLEARRPEAARADLERACRMAPMLAEPKLALAEAALETGDPTAALTAVADAYRVGDVSARMHAIAARAHAALSNDAEAAEAFGKAIVADPDLLTAYAALAAVETRRGRPEAARRAVDALLSRAPIGWRGAPGRPIVLSLQRLGEGAGGLASLASREAPHASGNFVAQMPTEQLRYGHFYADHAGSAAAGRAALAEAALLYNNWVNADANAAAGGDAAARALITAPDAPPVVNAPDAVAETTRRANAERYADAARFVFPTTLAVPHARQNGAVAQLTTSERADWILERLRPPLLLRAPAAQKGQGATLVDREATLASALARYAGRPVYAIAYHDCQGADGLFRRYRFAVVGGQAIPANMHIARGWNVHASERGAFDWSAQGLRRDELAFIEEPQSLLGAPIETVFAEILARCRLDIYGVDFGVSRAGQVVVFEANAAMLFTSRELALAFPHLAPHRARLVAAIEALFLARARR